MTCLNVSKTAAMGQIPAKRLKEAADILVYSLSKIINLLVKISIFPKECNITVLKHYLRRA